MIDFKALIHETPDFPKPGILFRDLLPLLRNHLDDAVAWNGVHAIAGITWRELDARSVVSYG